jgi:hypothetical protein
MGAGCHWQWASFTRRYGARFIIVALAGVFAFASSPQWHERVHHRTGHPAHACAVTLRNAGKCVKAIAEPFKPTVVFAPVALRSTESVVTPVLVPTLFLQVCCYEHGPPVLS